MTGCSPRRTNGHGVIGASALEDVAGALAVTNPNRAVRIAQSITDEHWKAIALARIAGRRGSQQ
jgi:hypothetical protein